MANYSSLQAVRDEGFTAAFASDNRVNALLTLATQYINEMCGQWFESREFPDSAPLTLDGDGSEIPVLAGTGALYGTSAGAATVTGNARVKCPGHAQAHAGALYHATARLAARGHATSRFTVCNGL